MKLVNCVSFGTLVLSASLMSSAYALDTKTYVKYAQTTIDEANTGFVANINELIQMQKTLVQLGIEGGRYYIQKHPEHAKLLQTVVDNAPAMMKMSLDEIEAQWHEGAYMKSRGFDLEKMDHFGELFSLMDAIIHPATSYIALTEYKKTRNADHLARASAELIEVVEHVAHVTDTGPARMFSSNK